MKRYIVRLLSASIIIIALLIAAAGLYQFIQTKIDSVMYPPPGKLVDVGGYKMHYLELGTGSPTVVLDAGMGLFSLDWSLVQPEIAKFAHVVSYDRSGLGWSDLSPHPRSSQQAVEELHELLVKANISPPYILVGHSLGGINIRLFASLFPNEVAGLVLVDSAHEKQMDLLPPQPPLFWIESPFLKKMAFLFGFNRFLYAYIQDAYQVPFSPDDKIKYFRIAASTKHSWAALDEMENLSTSMEQLDRADQTSFANKPMIVISAGQCIDCRRFGVGEAIEKWMEEVFIIWKELQYDLLSKSKKSKQVIAANSDHMVLWREPQSVISAVRELSENINVPEHSFFRHLSEEAR